MKTTLQLALTVAYTPTVPVSTLTRLLNDAAEHLADNGLLSGDTDAEVLECTHKVTVLSPAERGAPAPVSPTGAAELAGALSQCITVISDEVTMDHPGMAVALRAQAVLTAYQATLAGAQPEGATPPGPAVTAETHDDEHYYEVPSFDCTAWFAQASDDAIRGLVACDFGGDYAADAVAEFYDGKHPEVTAMFAHKRRGFECHVDEAQAIAWIRANRPHLAALVDGRD